MEVLIVYEAACVSIRLGLITLTGEQGEQWDYFEDCVSPEWWQLRFWIRRN